VVRPGKFGRTMSQHMFEQLTAWLLPGRSAKTKTLPKGLGMSHIGSLLCGHRHTEGIAKTALDQLSSSVDNFSSRAHAFLTGPASGDSVTFGPFCARVILENGLAAIVGRIDCFRMLYLSEFQSQPDYQTGQRARSGFSWAGDIIPDEKATQDLWSMDHDMAKISRALFAQHLNHIYWKPAVDQMLDKISAHPPDAALSEVLDIDAETFIPEIKGRCRQLYSTLSKGVHWEFFTSALLFDDATIKNNIRDTFLIVGQLGLVSHFIPTAYASLTPDDAVSAYIEFRKSLP
jgi:hypothetical protein